MTNKISIADYPEDAKDLFRKVASLFDRASAVQMRIYGVSFSDDAKQIIRLCNCFLTAYTICEHRNYNDVFAQYYDFQLMLKVKRILKGLDVDFSTLSDAKAGRLAMRLGCTFRNIASHPYISSMYRDYVLPVLS